ncbi:putative inner membrane transporter YicL [Anaerotignum neopropionicum]|uniref:Putative inner membrane transporter YicL n=1 Tax=Anaerotignum neopropionicum TaxID=36847 RepID=A0A136WF64_9FIRM|nr:DMT family transporter [Anaerotignum neopropionicum]KXL52989.1 putative inner membrane transporter YicL [Anaerotignum neopropionicum]
MARFGALLVVLASIIWSTGGPVIKILLDHGLTENEIFFSKAFFCVLSIVVFDMLFAKKISRIKSKRDLLLLIICGVVGYLFYGMFYGYAVGRIPISVAVILVYTAPALVTLFSVVFFKEKLTGIKKTCLFLIMLGCILVTGVFNEGLGRLSFAGVLWGVASGVCFAVYSITSSVMMKKYDAWTVTTYNFIFSLAAISFMVDIPQALGKVFADRTLLLTCIYFAVFCGTISNLVYVKAMEYIPASTAAMITTIEPTTTCMIGFVFFNEEINLFKIIGVLLIVAAVIRLNYNKAANIQNVLEGENLL